MQPKKLNVLSILLLIVVLVIYWAYIEEEIFSKIKNWE